MPRMQPFERKELVEKIRPLAKAGKSCRDIADILKQSSHTSVARLCRQNGIELLGRRKMRGKYKRRKKGDVGVDFRKRQKPKSTSIPSPITEAEMIAAFIVQKGVKKLPTRFAAPSQQASEK